MSPTKRGSAQRRTRGGNYRRWIAAHDAKVQESILREASAGFSHCPDYPYRAARWRATEDYLDDMADRIARGEDQTDE